MMYQTIRLVITSTALLFILATPVANATPVVIENGNYVQAHTQLDAGHGVSAGGGGTATHSAVADTGITSVVNGALSASGRAQASVTTSPSLKSISSSTAPDGASSSVAEATASWRDALVPLTAGAPATLDFNFSVHSFLTVSQTVPGLLDDNRSYASTNVLARNYIGGFTAANTGVGLSATVRNVNGVETSETGDSGLANLVWSSTPTLNLIDAHQYEFQGSFTFTSSLLSLGSSFTPAPFGFYDLGVGLTTRTINVGGTSTADAFGTLNLDSITTTGGALISASDFAFDSGTALSSAPTPAPVPLPASIILMISGLFGMFGMTKFRERSNRITI